MSLFIFKCVPFMLIFKGLIMGWAHMDIGSNSRQKFHHQKMLNHHRIQIVFDTIICLLTPQMTSSSSELCKMTKLICLFVFLFYLLFLIHEMSNILRKYFDYIWYFHLSTRIQNTKYTLALQRAENFQIIPVRTSRNFFRLGSAFLEGEMTKPSLKKLR